MKAYMVIVKKSPRSLPRHWQRYAPDLETATASAEQAVLETYGSDGIVVDVIEIVATQMCVASCAQHLEHTVTQLQDGHIERPAPQVVYGDAGALRQVQSIGQGRRSWLVDDPHNL